MIPDDRLDLWLAGLDDKRAGDALLAIGIRGQTYRSRVSPLGVRWPLQRWTLSGSLIQDVIESDLPPPELGPGGRPVRVAVETDALPDDVTRRLLGSPHVGSAFVAVQRPPGSLRRRPWRWPYRIGLLGFPADAEKDLVAAILAQGRLPPQLVRIQRVEDEPAAVDLLIVDARLGDAVSELLQRKPVANAVLILDRPEERWPLVASQLAAARAATAAAASALAKPDSLAGTLHTLLLESSHAAPFDVALTRATDQDLLLVAEPSAMAEAALPEVAVRTQAEATRAIEAFGRRASRTMTEAPGELARAAAGAFAGEEHEASAVAEASDRVEESFEQTPQERWLQATVGADNVLRVGVNEVSLFVGPPEAGAVRADEALDESGLPWREEQAEAFRLTIVFAPLVPAGEAQHGELDLPRVGRSRGVPFKLTAPQSNAEVAARIVVLFRNRVLQTAVLGGRVGETVGLRDVTAIVPALDRLDDRRAFDVALVGNETGGVAALIAHADGHTSFGPVPGLTAITERAANQLADAARQRSTKKKLQTPGVRELLVALAVTGHDLYDALGKRLDRLKTADRIQIVTAHSGWFLPLELAYPRYAPDDDAQICARYVADPATCDGKCTPDTDTTTVCPNAFWGLSKTIERHHFNRDLDPPQPPYLVLTFNRPRPGNRDIVVRRSVLAASRRVSDTDRKKAAQELEATPALDWKQWRAALESQDTDLLVLIPHAQYTRTSTELEIGNDTIPRGRIEAHYVTGGRKVEPVVILFGCRTTGKADDPAGFASRFIEKGARVVFHSSTDLLNVHATTLAARLAARLRNPPPSPQLLSEALALFRREAISDGLIAAFAITAYGDADWRI